MKIRGTRMRGVALVALALTLVGVCPEIASAHTPFQAATASGTYAWPGGYGKSSIYCEPNQKDTHTANDFSAARKFVAIYAHPWDSPDFSGTYVPAMRQAIYDASGFLDDQMGNMVERLKFFCNGDGTPVVFNAVLNTPSWSDSWQTVKSDLQNRSGNQQGYNFNWANEHYIVFYDNGLSDVALGQSDGVCDSRSGADNPSNGNIDGGLFSIQPNNSRGPTWEVFLHEMSHTLGAVQPDAPGSNGACPGHANALLTPKDIMDASVNVSNGGLYYDQNWDTYADPRPTPLGWLATHWNVAGGNDFYVTHWCAGPTDPAVPKIC